MFNIKTDNPNYLAKFFILKELRKHNNADKLQCSTVDGNNVITDLKAQINQLYVFFPLESAINKEFISFINAFSSPELNKDKKTKSFFNNHGRVRAIRLRKERSEGFIVPAEELKNWLEEAGIRNVVINDSLDGVYFSHYGDIEICKKYVNQIAVKSQEKESRRQQKKVKRTSKIVDGQFRLAEDTLHLKKLVEQINPEDYISIGYKMHGCQFSAGKVLCKKKLHWFEKIIKLLKIDIKDSYYDLVYGSRRVIKNEFADYQAQHYYTEDIWGRAAERIRDKLKDGISIHAEIVGHLSTGAYIQKDYDYGCDSDEFDVFVYRMFYTSPSGDVFEFSTPQMLKYCEKVGLKVVPIFYYGKAKDKYKELDVDFHWHRNFLDKLIEEYTEKDCYICKNNVPAEGICVIKNDDYFSAWKLKSFKFLERESIELDKGEINIEDVA